MTTPIQLPEIPGVARGPLVEQLAVLVEGLTQQVQQQAETIPQLRDEIAVLKGEKAKPTFKPSGMERKSDPEPPGDSPRTKHVGSAKRSKTAQGKIHEERRIAPNGPLPPASRHASKGIAISSFKT